MGVEDVPFRAPYIEGDAPRMPKRQERAMDNRRSFGARKKAKLN